jgi:hypothetical protein
MGLKVIIAAGLAAAGVAGVRVRGLARAGLPAGRAVIGCVLVRSAKLAQTGMGSAALSATMKDAAQLPHP